MKRSEINHYQQDAVDFFREHHFRMPPWTVWLPKRWQEAGSSCQEIKDCALGWDITDFGSGDFEKIGLLLFTIRNGKMRDPAYKKTYAEKIMIVRENQVTPIHFHWYKHEDIINRGGGRLKVQLWQSKNEAELAKETFVIHCDGIAIDAEPGHIVTLNPGESITIEPYVYHTFYAEGGKTLVGEVSTVNDDTSDNRFYQSIGRFPAIDEDEPTLYPLFSEYPQFK